MQSENIGPEAAVNSFNTVGTAVAETSPFDIDRCLRGEDVWQAI
jgi:hypothetical protein